MYIMPSNAIDHNDLSHFCSGHVMRVDRKSMVDLNTLAKRGIYGFPAPDMTPDCHPWWSCPAPIKLNHPQICKGSLGFSHRIGGDSLLHRAIVIVKREERCQPENKRVELTFNQEAGTGRVGYSSLSSPSMHTGGFQQRSPRLSKGYQAVQFSRSCLQVGHGTVPFQSMCLSSPCTL